MGDGTLLRDGVDAIIGCGDKILLPLDILQHLQMLGLVFLNQFMDHESTNIWIQGWRTPQCFKLEGNLVTSWNDYVEELKRAHIILREDSSYIVWSQNNTTRNYTMKLGYQILMDSKYYEIYWWCSIIWKVKILEK